MRRTRRTKRPLATATAMAACAVVTMSLAAPAGAAPPNTNLIDRADFEVPIGAGPARAYAPGGHIGPWQVSGATVAVAMPLTGIVDGIHGRNLQFLSLKDPLSPAETATGKVCQRVALDPTASYRLRFYSAAVTSDATLVVTWQGQTVGTFAVAGTIGDTDWQLRRISLGRSGATSGEVCFTGSGNGYALVDAVDLHATTP